MQINQDDISKKKQILETLRIDLKNEFFGIDAQIDKILDTIKTWYLMPQLFERPLIINLWGLTGVGKTSLIRKIVEGLNFTDRFLEMQMGGGENSSSTYWGKDSVFGMLQRSKIKEGEPGIILFDEFQRFRTIDEQGLTVKSKEFQDIWQLLSDGRCSKDFTLYRLLEDYLADAKNMEDEKDDAKKDALKMHPYEAKQLSKLLNGKYAASQLVNMDHSQLSEIIAKHLENDSGLLNYSKCLCIISGNLDEAFAMSNCVDDSDTDADFYCEFTKRISIFTIKKALQKRFRAEQIARLGNNNIIYPSLSKNAYIRLINRECTNITQKAKNISNIEFTLDDSLIEVIYNNSVFPAQGTRPVFSSIHSLFGSQISEAMLWGIENNIDMVKILIDKERNMIVYSNDKDSICFPIELQIFNRKKKYSQSYKTSIAVHEAGHALSYTLLKKVAPYEIKINASSWDGGYNLMDDGNMLKSKKTYIEDIIILLSGRAAEELIFGSENVGEGSGNDLKNATMLASGYIRRLGFEESDLGFVNNSDNGSFYLITDPHESNVKIKNILNDCNRQAIELLRANKIVLLALSKRLVEDGELSRDEYTMFMEKILGHSLIKFDQNMLNSPTNYDYMFKKQIEDVIGNSIAEQFLQTS